MVIVQRIDTVWTKASRGGLGARRRNAAPIAFPLDLLVAFAYIYERYHLDEASDFRPILVESRSARSVPSVEENLSLRLSEGLLLLKLLPLHGAPSRRVSPRTLKLYPGACGRLVTNARYTSGSGAQTYHRRAYNVGHDASVTLESIKNLSPEHRFSSEATLS